MPAATVARRAHRMRGNPPVLGSLGGVPNAQESQQPRDIRVMIIDDHEVVRRGIAEIVDFVVGKVLDLLKVEHDLKTRWEQEAGEGEAGEE